MPDLGNSMDLPFEPNPTPVPMADEHVHYSGGVIVMAAVVPVPDIGPKPALVFRFIDPLGEFYPAVVLVMDDDQMAGLGPMLSQAIEAARRGAAA